MASLSYVKALKRWRVRWRATNRTSHAPNRIFSGSRVFAEKAQAVAFFAEIEAQERLWRRGEVSTLDSIREAAKSYQTYCRRHTARTQEHYARVLSAFVASLPPGLVRVQQIDARVIEEYLYRLRDAGRTNRTLNAHLTAIKGFCRWLSERYSLPNPAARVAMLIEEPPQPRFLTRDEYVRLLAAADDLAHDRIAFLAHTGLRASEFCRLISETRSGSNGVGPQATAITITGKGRKRRTIPLNAVCRDILKRPHIYRPTGRNPLYQQIARVGRRARLGPVGPHALRHYFGTQLLLAGVPIIKVARLLGHSSVTTTERIYSHILPEDLQDVTELLSQPDLCLDRDDLNLSKRKDSAHPFIPNF